MKSFLKNKTSSLFVNTNIFYFIISMLCFSAATGLFAGVLNNFLHDVLHITKLERGIIEFPRELPGLLLFLITGMLYMMSEVRLGRIAFLIAMAGMVGIFFAGDLRYPAILFIVIWSTGEHMLMPVRSSITLHNAVPGKEGTALGSVRGFGNVGQVAGYFFAPLLFWVTPKLFPGIERLRIFRSSFVFVLILLITGFVLLLKMKERDRHINRDKLVFRRKFSKYYILEIFFGARKQVFLTFAPYVLITNYGAGVGLISTLYGIWSISNIFLNPLLGRLLDRFGYKKIITIDAGILVLLCILYGYSHRIFPQGIAFYVICVVFVLDAMLFAAGMARSMYVKRLSDSKAELTSTLSTGLSVNHLVSILIAVGGGGIWKFIGIEALFSFAAFFGIGSFIFSFFVKE